MKIVRTAEAGATEPGDIFVTVRPTEEKGIKIDLQCKSVIRKQFGPHIEKVIQDTVLKAGVENIFIEAKDKGALDYTIRARVETAIYRAI